MGGLVGWNNGPGIIQDSYATGNVTAGSGGTRAGGLTAQNNGRIPQKLCDAERSAAAARVLAAWSASTALARGPTIVNSYATGAVTATSFGGGLVGINAVGASVEQFLRDRSGQRCVVDHHHVVRRRTDRQQLRDRHAGPMRLGRWT